MYYLLLRDSTIRDKFILEMKKRDVNCTFHYMPLHSSPFFRQYDSSINDSNFSITNDISSRIVRLPLWIGLEKLQNKIIEDTKYVIKFLNKN
jgi:dTDP-4-amino-4,6-dideoxygalactose transaminase